MIYLWVQSTYACFDETALEGEIQLAKLLITMHNMHRDSHNHSLVLLSAKPHPQHTAQQCYSNYWSYDNAHNLSFSQSFCPHSRSCRCAHCLGYFHECKQTSFACTLLWVHAASSRVEGWVMEDRHVHMRNNHGRFNAKGYMHVCECMQQAHIAVGYHNYTLLSHITYWYKLCMCYILCMLPCVCPSLQYRESHALSPAMLAPQVMWKQCSKRPGRV